MIIKHLKTHVYLGVTYTKDVTEDIADRIAQFLVSNSLAERAISPEAIRTAQQIAQLSESAAIGFVPQSLTPEQKAQARENIGATDEAGSGLDPNNAALTGTTTADAISPNVHDIGTVSSGNAVLHPTKQENKAAFTGATATIVLPDTPANGTWVLEATRVGDITLTLSPSLRRQSTGDTVTQVSFSGAGDMTIAFKAIDGAFDYFETANDTAKIPGSSIELITDPNATLSDSTILSSQAVQELVEAYSVPYTPDYSSTVVTGDEINGAINSFGPHTKTITGNWSPTFTSFAEGREYIIEITNTGSYTVTWPADTIWPAGSTPTQTTGSKMDRYSVRLGGGKYRARRVDANWTVDTTAPTVVSRTIDATGEFYDRVHSEPIKVGTGGAGGLTLSNGSVATFVSAIGDTARYSLAPFAVSGATITDTYVQPGNGVEDEMGNDLPSYTAQSVTNNSTYSPAVLLVDEDFEGSGTPSGWTVRSGTMNFDYTTDALEGSHSAATSVNSSLADKTFTAQNEVSYTGLFKIKTNSGNTFPSTATSFAGFRDSSQATLLAGRVGASGAVTIFTNGGDSSASTYTLSVDTVYRYWLKHSSGGTSSLHISPNNTKPTVDGVGGVVLTRSATTGMADRIFIARGGLSGLFVWDKTKAQVADFGSNP